MYIGGVKNLVKVQIHVSDTRDVGVINMSFQRIPPSKRLQATPNHQLSPKHIRSSLGQLFFVHTLPHQYPVQVGVFCCNATTDPLVRLEPAIMDDDVALQIRNAPVLLDVVASNDRTPELGQPVDRPHPSLALEIAGGN